MVGFYIKIMEEKKNALDLTVISLFFTNLFILLYNNILLVLNLNNKQIIHTPFYFPSAVPEPYEIPLYLVLSGLFILAIFIAEKYLFTLKIYIPSFLKWIVLIFLALLLLDNLGTYPMKADHYPYDGRALGDYLAGFIFYIGAVSFFLVQTVIVSYLVRKSKYFFTIVCLMVVAILALFTFEARFPISAHDYSFFFGPIWEVAHGKTIYTQTPSQYGFLSILFLAFLFKVGFMHLLYLPVVVWILYVVQYFLVFYLVYKASRSVYLGLVSMFSVMTLNYFSLFFVAPMLPQGGPMRWLPLFVVPLLFMKFKRTDSWKFALLTALVSLWEIDVGISIFLGYFLTLFIFFIKKTTNLKTAIVSGLQLVVSFVFLLVIVNVFHLLLGYQAGDFMYAFNKLNEYAKDGYAMLPIEIKTYFWFLIFVYFASIIYFFRKKTADHLDKLIILVANFSLIGGIYYVGRSHPHNLFAIASLVIFNLFLLLSPFLKSMPHSKSKIAIYAVLFLVFVVYPANNRKEVLTETLISKYQRLTSGKVFSSEIEEHLNSYYAQEKKLIIENLPGDKVIIADPDDTYLLYLTQKGNLLDSNPFATVIAPHDLDYAVKSIKGNCPEKIAIDCRVYNKCPASTYKSFNEVALFVAPLILGRLENDCHVTYQPVACTTLLCIAQISNKTQ